MTTTQALKVLVFVPLLKLLILEWVVKGKEQDAKLRNSQEVIVRKVLQNLRLRGSRLGGVAAASSTDKTNPIRSPASDAKKRDRSPSDGGRSTLSMATTALEKSGRKCGNHLTCNGCGKRAKDCEIGMN